MEGLQDDYAVSAYWSLWIFEQGRACGGRTAFGRRAGYIAPRVLQAQVWLFVDRSCSDILRILNVNLHVNVSHVLGNLGR